MQHPRLPDRPLLDPPLVRAYQATGGRVVAEVHLELVTLVTAQGTRPRGLDDAHRAILDLSLGPMSIAELSGKTRLPALAVKVLVSDLLKIKAVTVTTPELFTGTAQTDDDNRVLEALLHGLQRRL